MPLAQWVCRARYIAGQTVEGLPPISEEKRAELDQMSIEQLQASIKETGTIKAGGRSIYRGVSAQNGKWHAQIRCSGKKKHLGMYQTEEEAAHAYDRAAIAKDGRYTQQPPVTLWHALHPAAMTQVEGAHDNRLAWPGLHSAHKQHAGSSGDVKTFIGGGKVSHHSTSSSSCGNHVATCT